MRTREFLHNVMQLAWRIFRVTGESFSDSLKKAWAVQKLSKAMKSHTVQFFYQKVNGEIRQAFGTMKEEVIHDKVKGSHRAKNEDLFNYWDTEKNTWRSFKKFNFIKMA